jgi:hypothetical protein
MGTKCTQLANEDPILPVAMFFDFNDLHSTRRETRNYRYQPNPSPDALFRRR